MRVLTWVFFCLVLINVLEFVHYVCSIDSTRLVLPPVVRAGTTATFLCLYDLEGALLYSVKWYRGNHEFFRFAPSETPPAKVFSFPGLFVDIYSSNEHQVTLRNIPAHLTGEVTCEVTIEAPYFSTSSVTGNLTVLELDIELTVPRRHLYLGETLIAFCKALTSAKDAQLSFRINSQRVRKEFVSFHPETPEIAKLELNMTNIELELQRFAGGELHLRCSASIGSSYYATSQSVLIHIEEAHMLPESSQSHAENHQTFKPLFVVLFLYNKLF